MSAIRAAASEGLMTRAVAMLSLIGFLLGAN